MRRLTRGGGEEEGVGKRPRLWTRSPLSPHTKDTVAECNAYHLPNDMLTDCVESEHDVLQLVPAKGGGANSQSPIEPPTPQAVTQEVTAPLRLAIIKFVVTLI